MYASLGRNHDPAHRHMMILSPDSNAALRPVVASMLGFQELEKISIFSLHPILSSVYDLDHIVGYLSPPSVQNNPSPYEVTGAIPQPASTTGRKKKLCGSRKW